MNSTKKEKIKNWLIITRIRITNFIKEHKYVSAVIGLFLISAVVGLVVSATNDTIDSATVSDVVVRANTTTNNNYANNFSIINYRVSYKIGSACVGETTQVINEVTVSAKLARGNNGKIPEYVKWQNVQGEIGKPSINDETGTITVTIANADPCGSSSIDLPLMVLNATKDSVVKLESVEVTAGSKGTAVSKNLSDQEEIKTTYQNELEKLEVMVVGGMAPKNEAGGRNIKYGILVGFPNEVTSLEGYKIQNASSNLDIYIYASDESEKELELETEDNQNYGIYTQEIANNHHYFADLPVLSAGKIDTKPVKEKLDNNDSSETIDISEVTLNDSNILTFESSNESFDYISDVDIVGKDENEEVQCSGESTSDCYVNLSSVNLSVPNSSYDLIYKVSGYNNTIKMKQTINVEAPQNSDHPLKGPKTLYLKDVFAFKDYGIVSQGNIKSVFYEPGKLDEADPEIENFENTDEIIQEYKINDTVGSDENPKRIIKFGEEKHSIDKISAETNRTVAVDDPYQGNIKIGENTSICDKEHNCTFSLNNTHTVGAKDIKYTIKKSLYEVEINATLNIVNKYYKLSIKDIDYSNLSPVLYRNNGRTIFALSSAFVTVKSKSLSANVGLQASTTDPKTADKVFVKTSDTQVGTNSYSNDFYVNESTGLEKVDDHDKTGLSGKYYTASVGEKVELLSTFNYGADADNNLNGLQISLDVNENLTPTSLSENVEDTNNYYNVDYVRFGEELEGLDSTIQFCSSEGECKDTPTDIKVKTINLIINGQIQKGTNITLRTNYIVELPDKNDKVLEEYFTSTATFKNIVGFGNDGKPTYGDLSYKSTSKKVYLTPYKLRTSVEVGEFYDEEFITGFDLDISNNKKYTLSSSINVTSPIMRLNTNVFGYSEIKKIPIKFTLPEGVYYVYNANYQMQPDTNGGIVYKDGKTILTYTYTGVEPNSWYETIFFDFTIDVAKKSGPLQIDVTAGDPVTNSIENDISSDRYKYLSTTLNANNYEPVSYGQYIYNANKSQMISSMNEGEEFRFETKVYNNELTSNKTTKTNVNVYTILPYNDEGESSYSGTYTIKFISDTSNIQCTSENASVVKNDFNAVEWKDCSTFKSGDYYTGITAYKTNYASINLGSSATTEISVKSSGNSFSDIYKFNSYMTYDKSNSIYKFQPAKIEVVSKNITGVVWEDFNENGIMEDDEKRIDSVILHLYDESNNEVKEPVSPNKNGVYSFSGLDVGKYYIVAEFNYDKYGISPYYSDYTDLSKISVFRTDSTEVIKPSENDSESSEANDNSQTNVTSEDSNNDTDDDGDEGDSSEGDEGASGDEGSSEEENEPEEDKTDSIVATVKTDLIEITEDTRSVKNINLGLALKRHFQPKLNKYITRAEVTNALGIITKTDFGKTKLAKLNVKSMNNSNIKIVYMLEIENIKYYPGYVRLVTETIPEGMAFNKDYSENAGWTLHDDGTITNNSLANETISEGEKKYLTIAFDLVSKEAGSFVNLASIDDAKILGGVSDDK